MGLQGIIKCVSLQAKVVVSACRANDRQQTLREAENAMGLRVPQDQIEGIRVRRKVPVVDHFFHYFLDCGYTRDLERRKSAYFLEYKALNSNPPPQKKGKCYKVSTLHKTNSTHSD